MNINIPFMLVGILNSFMIMAAMTNLLIIPLNLMNKLFIYFYILLCQLFFGSQLGQNIIIFTIGGAILIVAASSKHYIINSLFALLGYLLSIFINYILITFLNLFQFTVSDIYSRNSYLLTFVIICTVITCIVSFLLGKYLRILYINEKMIFSKEILLLFVAEIAICAFVFTYNIIQGEREGYPAKVIYFNTILFSAFFIITLIIFLFSLRIMYKNQKLQSLDQEKQSLVEYMEKIEDLYQDMRIFKHDYINILSTMQYCIDNDDIDNLKLLFRTKILPSSKQLTNKDATLGKLSNIKILELKGILYAKLISAMNQQLDITLEIQEEISSISMDMLDLSRIIGIFMDNAIEAARISEDKNLVVLVINSEESITIVISNSTPDINIDLDIIYKKDITSKKGHTGLGLYSVRKTLNKYNNIIHSTNYNYHIFTQTLEICTQYDMREVTSS